MIPGNWSAALVLVSTLVCAVAAETGSHPSPAPEDRPRIFILTDISNEPDDEESLVRFLVYANEFDVEGLVATTSTWLRQAPREDLIRRQISAYEEVLPNLRRHAAGYPSADYLRAVTFTGQPAYGMEAVGSGLTSEGSRHLAEVAMRHSERPLWISIWGGANTLAQALWDLQNSSPPAELDRAIHGLRVYTISDQDDAGLWLRNTFPNLFYIVSPSTQDWKEYWRATWTGISGDRHYRNGPFHHFDLVDNPWLEENVIRNHGPLGRLYPRLAYIMEGDTPSFLGLISNGLAWHHSPAWGGWGGRYVHYRAHGESRPIWTNNMDSRDTVTAVDGRVYISDQATIWRWRLHFQHDFAARMDWCIAGQFEDANHNPEIIVNGHAGKKPLFLSAQTGDFLRLNAEGSRDPDNNELHFQWLPYPEAGTAGAALELSNLSGATTEFRVPEAEPDETFHVILQAQDNGSPSLFAYRRIVVRIAPESTGP